MGRKNKYIETLTEEQKASLHKGYSYGKSPLLRKKCHCILMSHSGKNKTELSSFFQVSEHSILQWFKLWEKNGIEGLTLKAGRGRKAKLDIKKSNHVEKVKLLIENEPKNLNKVQAQIAQDLGVDVCKRTVKRFLKNLNTSTNASPKD